MVKFLLENIFSNKILHFRTCTCVHLTVHTFASSVNRKVIDFNVHIKTTLIQLTESTDVRRAAFLDLENFC